MYCELTVIIIMSLLGDALFTTTQQKVLGLLYAQPDKSFYTKEILRLTGMGVATIKRELDRMLATGILTMNKVGNQHHYQANKSCPIYSDLLNIVRKIFAEDNVLQDTLNKQVADKPMHRLVEKYRTQILKLARENGVSNVRVFGSMARNSVNKESDLDLLVDLEEGSSGFSLGGFLEDVSKLVDRKVDVVTEKSLHPTIREKVLREAKTL